MINKRGSIFDVIIFGFIVVLLFTILAGFINTEAESIKPTVDIDVDKTFLATITEDETLSPIGEGITSVVTYRNNDTWLELDGNDDYVFIPDSNLYYSVVMWVNNSDNNWTLIANSSDLLFENNGTVVAEFTMNPFKKNATGWYFGINDSGFFEGNIDTIKFYNDSMNETQISDLFINGR